MHGMVTGGGGGYDPKDAEHVWSPPLYTFFIVAETFSFIALAGIILIVLLSRTVTRSTAWVHFCITCACARRCVWDAGLMARAGLMFAFAFLLPLLGPPRAPRADPSALCMVAAILRFAVYPLYVISYSHHAVADRVKVCLFDARVHGRRTCDPQGCNRVLTVGRYCRCGSPSCGRRQPRRVARSGCARSQRPHRIR
jgi:hypothetical protein